MKYFLDQPTRNRSDKKSIISSSYTISLEGPRGCSWRRLLSKIATSLLTMTSKMSSLVNDMTRCCLSSIFQLWMTFSLTTKNCFSRFLSFQSNIQKSWKRLHPEQKQVSPWHHCSQTRWKKHEMSIRTSCLSLSNDTWRQVTLDTTIGLGGRRQGPRGVKLL